MSLDVNCPSCGAAYSLADDLTGKRIRCKNCGEMFAAGNSQGVAPTERRKAAPSAKGRATGPSDLQREPIPKREAPLPSVEQAAEAPPAPSARSSSLWWIVGFLLGGAGLATFCCGGAALGIGLLVYRGNSPSSAAPVASNPSDGPVDGRPNRDKPPDGPPGPRAERMKALHDGKFMQPPRNATEDTSLRVISDPGDFIGQGKTYSYNGNQLVLRKIPAGGLSIFVDDWSVEFVPPKGGVLKTGEYLNAKRSSSNDNAPGMEFSGHGRGCNSIAGQFVVWELEMNGDQITRVAIDFLMKCEGNGPPLYGMLRYHSKFD
jgi:predicted Zn finger-like uncharacterized protein